MGGAALNWNREPSGTRKREREKGRGGSVADLWYFAIRFPIAVISGCSHRDECVSLAAIVTRTDSRRNWPPVRPRRERSIQVLNEWN